MRTATPSSTASAAAACAPPVVALDPGHNPVEVSGTDPVTGVAMRDYPNGAEDGDVMAVALLVQRALTKAGYRVVLLKKSAAENIDYRRRVTRAERAGADVGVSIHTYTGDHKVFVQRVGLYREGTGADGKPLRVTFRNAATAAKSQRYARAVAAARSRYENRRVVVADNNFNGRAPLWGGNIPMIALMAQHTPWVYNEFGTATGGGSIPIGDAAIATYARGLADGIRRALPNKCARPSP
ncbi:MAG: N-acetylmuramoyl-L-alanine amidase [Gordonia sp. (in: high G+C Gram-positive bacteria)]|uniref:N-acetylmuramoyl-L-alanine amidase n=1 Tax=Gordonia sp. (in: high G+C Gram-positive bacteria) TaxID=84139 RepID=UPI0039E31A91